MEENEIFDELDILGFQPLAFDVDTFIQSIRPDADPQTVRNILCNDPRFIRLSSSTDIFIWHFSLFEWFSNLNIRLAKAHKFRLNESQLTNIMNDLLLYDQWNFPPLEAILWAQSLGLISRNSNSEYVFPIAKILSYLSLYSLSISADILEDFYKKHAYKSALQSSIENLLEDFLRMAFPKFSDRIVYIIKAREEFLSGSKITLEQIANSLGLTRERVRQMEGKFWNGLQKQNKRLLVMALLHHIMKESGSLIVESDSSKVLMVRFLAQCLEIPYGKLPQIGILVLGMPSLDFTLLKSLLSFPQNIETNTVSNYLESQTEIVLNNTDIKTIADRFVQFNLKRMTKTQRVYIALRSIGRPAHYTKVAEVYDALFPNHISSEHNIHAALSRRECGVVWVGMKGIYALKEWGFETPTKSLINTVTNIVKTIYKQTKKPVPLSVIMAEIGKYRKIFNPLSFQIVISLNPKLRRVSKGLFIPQYNLKHTKKLSQNDISSEKLDEILQEFGQES